MAEHEAGGDAVGRAELPGVGIGRTLLVRERLSAEAIEPMPMTPAEFGDFMRADIARWSALARERNISLD